MTTVRFNNSTVYFSNGENRFSCPLLCLIHVPFLATLIKSMSENETVDIIINYDFLKRLILMLSFGEKWKTIVNELYEYTLNMVIIYKWFAYLMISMDSFAFLIPPQCIKIENELIVYDDKYLEPKFYIGLGVRNEMRTIYLPNAYVPYPCVIGGKIISSSDELIISTTVMDPLLLHDLVLIYKDDIYQELDQDLYDDLDQFELLIGRKILVEITNIIYKNGTTYQMRVIPQNMLIHIDRTHFHGDRIRYNIPAEMRNDHLSILFDVPNDELIFCEHGDNIFVSLDYILTLYLRMVPASDHILRFLI